VSWVRTARMTGLDEVAAVRARSALVAGSGLAVLVAASVGLGVVTTVRSTTAGLRNAVTGVLPTTGVTRGFWVTEDEMRAGEWLALHAPPRDLVATNVHCEQVRPTHACASRSFWVSAMTEHAVALEGWAYQDSVMARHGAGGLSYFRQPAPDFALLHINDAAFRSPTQGGLATLRNHNGTRWLFADDRAGPVSTRLTRLAELRYRSPSTACGGDPRPSLASRSITWRGCHGCIRQPQLMFASMCTGQTGRRGATWRSSRRPKGGR
jgi:hypothetical protein